MKEKGLVSRAFNHVAERVLDANAALQRTGQRVMDTNVMTAISVFDIAAGTALTVAGMPLAGVPAVAAGVTCLLTNKR